MDGVEERWHVNHYWIDWALRRGMFADCACTPEWRGVQMHGGQPQVLTMHRHDCLVRG